VWLSRRVWPLVFVASCHFSPSGSAGDLATSDLATSDLAVGDLGSQTGQDLAVPPGSDLQRTDDLRAADLGLQGSITHTWARPPDTVTFAAGDTDWVHWGGQLERKSGINRISDENSTIIAGVTPDCMVTFSWSDGTPDAVATAKDCLVVGGKNNGFSFTAPAGLARHTLTVWLGTNAALSISASLSDNSASDGDFRSDPGDALDEYTFTYNAAADNQTITIQFRNANTANQGSVSLLAAKLR
jgi:hypothetical protein